ncbi:hypothetical protein GCM10020001_046040 [Nonomuraea salmonea]
MNEEWDSTADSMASTSLSRMAWGASAQPTRKPGGQCLGEGAEVDDAVGVVGAQRAQRLAVEAEQSVRVVLDDQDPGPLADVEHLLAAGDVERDTGRVLEGRDGVEELDGRARGFEGVDRLGQRLGHDALVVHGDVDDFGLISGERAEGAHVGGTLCEHHVARVDEDAGDEVEGLLRPDGDDDVVRPGVDPLQLHDLADLLAQVRVTLAGAVLQRDGAAPRDEVGDELADHVEGEGRDVRHAAGERDHLGPRRDGEESSDLGGDHPGSSRGVPIDVGVNARPLGRGCLTVIQLFCHGPPPKCLYRTEIPDYARRTCRP